MENVHRRTLVGYVPRNISAISSCGMVGPYELQCIVTGSRQYFCDLLYEVMMHRYCACHLATFFVS